MIKAPGFASSCRQEEWRRYVSMTALIVSCVLALGSTASRADPNHELDTAAWIGLPISAIDGFFPTPWDCGGATPSPQIMLQFHQNWHCNNPDHIGANWGNRFFGFHKQFLLGYDRYLASVGEPYVGTWVAAPGALIPPAHGGRASNSPCTTCLALPTSFKLPAAGGTLDTFASVTAIGDAIVDWHNVNHGRIAAAGGAGSCFGGSADMNCPSFSTRDPIFYRYHHIFDDVQNAWRTLQSTDIAIVLDRSGSMSLNTAGGGTRLDAAKSAASLFADLLEDGTSHRLGMVSFSTAASNPADMPLTSVAGAPAALTAALTGVAAAGSTSIGDGLLKGQALVAGGSNQRKAMLLLTDGMENSPPTIGTAQNSLGDTHVCSVGLGTPGSLDGPKLRDLSERQGGIYISTPNALELKKFFVFCFADIFDSFAGEDPISTLPAAQFATPLTTHMSVGDEKIVFVLSWTDPLPIGSLRLAVTTPSGWPVDLNAPGVESVFGPTWHIVRIKPPYRGDRNGNWSAQGVRPVRGFVNGFSSNAFVDLFQGANLVRAELNRLCTQGCKNVLYYEDEMAHESFDDHNTVYGEALYNEAGRGVIGNIVRPADAAEFTKALSERRFDLLVYSSQFTEKQQPYDDHLARLLCDSKAPRFIVADNRSIGSAQNILRCAGALRGERTNFQLIKGGSDLYKDDIKLRPQHHAGAFSYELKPTTASVGIQARHEADGPVILAQGLAGKEQPYFISTLTRSGGRVVPFTYRSRNYTFESLHPSFHIPEPYRPEGGYDRVEASVDVTPPLRPEGRTSLAATRNEGLTVSGDNLTPRQAALVRAQLADQGKTAETRRFKLFDDGTNGDGTPDDRYFEAALPPDFAANDGEYQLHAYFTMCKGDACIKREAQQTLIVETKLSPESKVTQSALRAASGRKSTRVILDPRDRGGNPFGPGMLEQLVIKTAGNVEVVKKSEGKKRGTYEFTVNYGDAKGAATLEISQQDRPGDVIKIELR